MLQILTGSETDVRIKRTKAKHSQHSITDGRLYVKNATVHLGKVYTMQYILHGVLACNVNVNNHNFALSYNINGQ